MKGVSVCKIVLILSAILFAAMCGSAQDAMIAGLVVDINGARIPSATIHAVRRSLAKDFASDEEGFFKGNLPAGHYLFTVQKIGFRPRSAHALLKANAVTSLNFILRADTRRSTKCPKGILCL